MTRNGVFELRDAGAQPPARDPRAPVVTIAVRSVATSRVPGRQYTAEVQQSGMSASTTPLPAVRRAIADIGRGAKSP